MSENVSAAIQFIFWPYYQAIYPLLHWFSAKHISMNHKQWLQKHQTLTDQ